MAPHDPAQLYRALVARDPRFDGVFFVGVTSTGIYCRPVCPAPTPRADRCRFYASAAAAERRGFRPCLRCRPELAPGRMPGVPDQIGHSSIDAIERLARVAASRITAGALDQGGIDALAAELGVSSRHLRRAVERELGAAPVALAQTRRLLTAKQLLTETDLPVTQVALASGFRSVRRFNALFRTQYRLAPTALRRSRAGRPEREGSDDGATVTLSLAYRPPLHWPTLHAYLAGRATPGVEAAGPEDGGWYARTVTVGGVRGWVRVSPGAGAARDDAKAHPTVHDHAVRVELSTALLPALVPLMARLRRQFDLDADPAVIDAHLAGDPRLAKLVRRRPGLRTPGAFGAAELAVRAVLGQQVSVRGATTLAGRLARAIGEPLAAPIEPHGSNASRLTHLPIDIGRLADAPVEIVAAIGLTRARSECLVSLARAIAGGELPELSSEQAAGDPSTLVRRLTQLPGIGEWTAGYIVMRGLQWPDAFPHGDLGLRKAMGGLTPARLRAMAEQWRPWRSYAAHHLWAALGDDTPAAGPPAPRRRRQTLTPSTPGAAR